MNHLTVRTRQTKRKVAIGGIERGTKIYRTFTIKSKQKHND